jgi:hypothetical protein
MPATVACYSSRALRQQLLHCSMAATHASAPNADDLLNNIRSPMDIRKLVNVFLLTCRFWLMLHLPGLMRLQKQR